MKVSIYKADHEDSVAEAKEHGALYHLEEPMFNNNSNWLDILLIIAETLNCFGISTNDVIYVVTDEHNKLDEKEFTHDELWGWLNDMEKNIVEC